MLFNQTFENIGRLRKIIEVLLKYGFDDVVTSTRLNNLARKAAKTGKPEALETSLTTARWERIRQVIEELGPTFIKLGQFLSNRPDLLPEPLIKEFEKLQDEVAPFPVEQARDIIETETGISISELFLYFDDKPLGSASIGQVHRARLATGEDVVVKIQRPNAGKQVMADLSLLREFVKLTENYFVKAGILNPLDILETFSKTLRNELDYMNEVRHMVQFSRIFGDLEKLQIPQPYQEFCSTKVLIIEFISGCKVTDVQTIRSWGLLPSDIAKTGLDLYLTQIFDYGIFHADPHPGNVLVKPNGNIALIDFGIVGKLMPSQKYAFAGVFISLAKEDAKSMAIHLRRLAVDHDIQDMKSFEFDLNDLIQNFMVLNQDEMNIQDFTGRLQKLSYKYKLQIPGSIFLILRSLAILEGVTRVLDPDFNVLENIKPYGAKILAEQFSYKNISRELKHSFQHIYALMYNLPLGINDILKQIRKGKASFNIRVQGYDTYINEFHLASNRLVMALIVGALIIASAIAYSASVGKEVPGIIGIPYFSIICWVLSGIVLFFMLINNIRSGRNRNH